MAPAIALLAASVIGLGCSIFNVILSFGDPKIDPNAPPMVQEIQKNTAGPAVTVIQSICALMNGVIIFGAIMMMQLKMRPLAMTASIIALVNFGSCCCLLGIPFGIWSLVILNQPDVKAAFDQSSYV